MAQKLTIPALERLFDPFRTTAWTADFLKFDTAQFEKLWRTAPPSTWERAGERRALSLFHRAAVGVPAYRDFLRKHKVRHENIKTIVDFLEVPLTNKQNYVNAYLLRERLWKGSFSAEQIVAMSSGTTGEPKYWPRGGFQEFEAAVVHELLYRSLFTVGRERTLAIVGFPMGVYVSGIATLLATWLAAQKLPNLSIVSVGNNKTEAIRILRGLKDNFTQILLIGHPFFIKDVVETAREKGAVRWSQKKVKMLLCSEGFSESWRAYVAQEAGGQDPASIMSVYGSSEFLLMGYETPLTIELRRSAEGDTRFQNWFGGAHQPVPNLFQYNPLLRYVEAVDGNLVFTAASGVPLVRFDLKDAGRVIGYGKMLEEASASVKHIARMGWKLPFVTLAGRSDRTMVFYAANIYPEHIHSALHQGAFYSQLTGKFAMRKGYKKNMDEFLEINIELRPDRKPTKKLVEIIKKQVTQHLLKINLEYQFLWNHLDKDIRPRIVLRPYQYAPHFKPGLKPRYIIENTN